MSPPEHRFCKFQGGFTHVTLLLPERGDPDWLDSIFSLVCIQEPFTYPSTALQLKEHFHPLFYFLLTAGC